MGKIPDIKVGLPFRSMTRHKKSFNSDLTLNFGQVSALGVVEMDGKTKLKGSLRSLVRMTPLPVPTFGQLSYKTYARFVPIKDIFRNYENLRGGRSLTTQFGTFTPTQVPTIKISELTKMLLEGFCKYNVYYASTTGSSDDFYGNLGNVKARVTLSFNTSYLGNEFGLSLDPEINMYYPSGSYSEDEGIYDVDTTATFINPENADFVYSHYTENADSEFNEVSVYCFRLTKRGKILARILSSLGIKFDLHNTREISILPILAFYKGYFDLFVPKNNLSSPRNYTDSWCFRLSDYICEHDVKNVVSVSDTKLMFGNLLADMADCYYYQDPDFITGMIAKPSISPNTAPDLSDSASLALESVVAGSPQNQQPRIPYAGNNISALNIKLLLRLLPYVNKDTVIGGDLRRLIKSRFGYDVETLEGATYTAGTFDLPINISAVTANAATFEDANNPATVLGQQGGMGVSANDGNSCLHVDFKAKEPGYMVFYCVIIPKASFFQGIDPMFNHGVKGRFSIYDPAFDSLGFDLFSKDILLADVRSDNIYTFINEDGSSTRRPDDRSLLPFGFIPRYMDYKVNAMNVKSGDLIRRFSLPKFAGWYLDKLITPNVSKSTPVNDSTQRNTFVYDFDRNDSLPVANPELRSIGKLLWFENFDRIFYLGGLRNPEVNSDGNVGPWEDFFGYDDNFIIDNVLSLEYYDHSKPSSESFETDGEGKYISVSHA